MVWTRFETLSWWCVEKWVHRWLGNLAELERHVILYWWKKELREKAGSPVGSTGSVTDSVKSESPSSSVPEDRKDSETAKAATSQDWNWNGMHFSEEDSYDLVTCYCTKPFAGRAMIECSRCLTWIHLSCAKIKKSNIPEVFICMKCKHQKYDDSDTPDSSSVRHKKRLSV